MTIPVSNCPHCGAPLFPGALVCPTCHQPVYMARLVQLFQEAQRQESIDPTLAAATWRQCLPLLPPNSMEYQQIANRAAALAGGAFTGAPAQPSGRPVPLNYARPPQKQETWQTVLFKTGGSMALCMYIYHLRSGRWDFAIGFVLLILIHELGHTVANWYYGIRQSPPIFIPYMGALIVLRQNPPDAKAEAVIGIAGPIAGTFGALGCYAAALWTGSDLLGALAISAFYLNLFNLIPIWPLDGGRVAAGITPILWIPGALGFAAFLFAIDGFKSITTLLVAFFILQSTFPHIRNVIFRGGIRSRYYKIGAPARIAIIISYVLLAVLLFVFALPDLIEIFHLRG